MTRNETLYIIRSHYNTLSKYATIIKRHFRPEDIHKFRVEYKKLRAFLRMISFNRSGGRELRIESKIKTRYRTLGKMGDIQLQHLRFRKTFKEQIHPNKIYFASLGKDIRKLQSTFTNKPFKKLCRKGIRKNAALLYDEFTKEEYEKYIDDQWAKVNVVISGNDFSDSNIHNIRKGIKDIYYNVQAVEKSGSFDAAFTNDTAKNQLQYFNELLEDLGNFQDTCTAIDMLESSLIHSHSLQEQQLLIYHRTKLIAEKNALKHLVIEQLLHHFAEYNFTSPAYTSKTM